jgi:hypothetical protein
VYALGSPVIGCSALGARAYGTKATPLADGDTLAASAIRSWGEMCPTGGYPYRGARRDLGQQLGRTRARDWAGSTGRAGRSNDGERLAFLLCTVTLLVCCGARHHGGRRDSRGGSELYETGAPVSTRIPTEEGRDDAAKVDRRALPNRVCCDALWCLQGSAHSMTSWPSMAFHRRADSYVGTSGVGITLDFAIMLFFAILLARFSLILS